MEYGFIGDPEFLPDTNPFKQDVLAAIGRDDDSASTVSTYVSRVDWEQPRMEQIKHTTPRGFKLPEFWPHAPQLWFCRAEFRFEVVGVTSQREKFAHVVEALPYDSLKIVKDLLVSPPTYQPYQALKDRLLLATQLTPIQMAEKLMKEASLGDRRPSQMLASLLEFCPPGEENTALFRASFLMRLPSDIRGHLDGREDGDLKELAAKADRHWCNKPGAAAAVAAAVSAMEEEDSGPEVVAAVGGSQYKRRKQKKGGQSGHSAAGGGEKPKQDWSGLVKINICKRHQQFGTRCYNCADPAGCQFEKLQQGN